MPQPPRRVPVRELQTRLVVSLAIRLSTIGLFWPVVACSFEEEPRLRLSVQASAMSGASADAIEVELRFEAGRDTDSGWQEENVVPVPADCTILADGTEVVRELDSSEWTAQVVGYPRMLDVIVDERGGASHHARFQLPELFAVSLTPEHPESGDVRVEWSPSGGDGVSVDVDLVHRDDGLSSWMAGKPDDGSETMVIGGPLNFADVSRSRTSGQAGMTIASGLRIRKAARPPASDGDACDSDDDCEPLRCDALDGVCRTPAALGAACKLDRECASGLCNLHDRICREPAAAGSACLRDAECASGQCPILEQRCL